jgi:histidyl-tRNA synthetase
VIWVLMKTLDNIFSEFDLENNLILRLNNKKIIQWLLDYLKKSGLNQDILQWLSNLLDKYHKLSSEDFENKLKELIVRWWFSENVAIKFKKLILDFIDWNFDIGLRSNKIFSEWMTELDVVYNGVLKFLEWFDIKRFKVVKDFSIIRGLDYYTGTVFETFVEWCGNLWSICSWGRYDNLTGYIDSKKNYFSWVGGSIGINRLFSWLVSRIWWVTKFEDKYLIVNFGFGDSFIKSFELMVKFLKEWKIVEIYPRSERLKKQFKYADKKRFRYVITMGEDEIKRWVYKIKDMETGQEEERDL